MKTKTILALFAAAAGLALSAAVPEIRYTSVAPFDAEGRRVESEWKKADTCVRFVEVVTSDVALDQSEAQLLFDDKNIYASLTGFCDPKSRRGNADMDLFAGNNFELMVKPEGCAEFHACVGEFGHLYLAMDKSEAKIPGVSAKVEKGKGRWTANLVVPFSAFGIAAPAGEMKARVGIFRSNVDVHERQKLFNKPYRCISGYTPNKFNFTDPAEWAEMTFTRKAGEAARVAGPSLGRRINLFANPEFNVPGRGWNAEKNVAYMETQPMSEEWVYRVSGKCYQALTGRPVGWKPKTKYTLVVKARSFGGNSALRIIEQTVDKNGKLHEGTWIATNMPVGSEMHEYYMPFTSSAGKLKQYVFYKVDSNSPDTGIDIAAIRLYEGELPSFEVRKFALSGRQAIVPGTAVAPPPSAYGRLPRPLRALVVIGHRAKVREAHDIFAGTGAEVDVITATQKDQDVYYTEGDPVAVTKRIEKGEYGLYMVPKGAAKNIGKELAGKMLEAVKKGEGLYIEANKDLNHLKPVEKGGAYGSGRVFRAAAAGSHSGYFPEADPDDYGRSFFPRRRFTEPQVLADAVKAAFGEPSIPADAKTRTETFVYAGFRHVATWTLDAAGRTLAWKHETAPVAGTKLGAFGDDGATSSVAVEGDAAGMALRWEFSDFTGRVLARGETPAAAKVSFKVPRERLYTNYGGIRLELLRGGEVADQRGECIFVAGNDRARLMDDFTTVIWPGTTPIEDVPLINRRLEEIGFRATIISAAGAYPYGQALSTGLSCGGSWLGDGSWFCARKSNGNIRNPSLNTARWRGSKRGQVRELTEKRAKYGLFQNALCDEPNLSGWAGSDEVDAHPENLAEYRVRMERKYGTIAEYNRRHGTAHKSFADVGQGLLADARASGVPAEFIEWRNFNVDRWVEAIRLVSDGSHDGDPDTPFSICETGGQFMFLGNDYWKLLTRAGIGLSQEYTSMVYFNGHDPVNCNDEVYRSFRPDVRVWGWTGYFFTKERETFMPWWFAAHRFGGFSWFSATDSPSYCIIDPTTYSMTVDAKELRESLDASRLMDGLGKAFLEYGWAKRGIAIYFSHESMLLASFRGTETKNKEIAQKGPLHDYMFSRLGAQYLAEDLLYQYDYVAPEQVTGGKLADYKVLVMPRINAMGDAEVAAVKAFIAKGGRVVADELPGGCDELGMPRAANPFEGVDGVTVVGRNFDDLDAAQRAAALAYLQESGVEPVLSSPTIVDTFGREAMHFTDGVNDIYAVLRHPARSQDNAEETFVFRRGGYVWDVRARKPLGRAARATTTVPRADAAVFAVLPYEAKGVSIAAPGAAKAGSVLSVGVRLDAAGAAVGTHVFNVRFVPPSGECRFHFRRNVAAKGGVTKVDFPLALNDEKGVWKVVAEDALTGLRAERTFELR